MSAEVSVFWFRRDLRLHDNRGLLEALTAPFPVLPVFIFDTEILDGLSKEDPRVNFIFESLQEIREGLQNNYGSSLAIYKGSPLEVFKEITANWNVKAVFTNRDYEPYARKRDHAISEFLREKNIDFRSFKDQVIFQCDEVVKDNGDPYVVYTPFMKKWKEHFTDNCLTPYPSEDHLEKFYKSTDLPSQTLSSLGFKAATITIPPFDISDELIGNYEDTRNFPAKDGTSHLGPYLRFGQVSVRAMVSKARVAKNETFWNELIWREFFMQILWHFPHTTQRAFKPKYDRINWRNDKEEFEKWKAGKTGYALVDAGMRELNQSGYMHNRVRMLVASFLCKHLLIDWRWGEAYFAEKLLDFELSSNVGNWQWAAGSGVDAAPYFRIFNPMTQVEKFDKDQRYIKKWVPEFGSSAYPDKMVDHKTARIRCLETYKAALD